MSAKTEQILEDLKSLTLIEVSDLVEKIRVNTKYIDLPLQPTQAEIISLCLFLGGVFLWWKAGKWNLKQQSKL